MHNTWQAAQKDQLEHSIWHYWPIRSKLAKIDGIATKGKRIIIPFILQKQILQQLHSNQMGRKNTRPLECEVVYLININTDIENTVKHCATCMAYQQTQPSEKIIQYEMAHRTWEVVGNNIFTLLCMVDYYRMFPFIKKTDGLSADSLIIGVKIVVAEFGLPEEMVSDAGTNFISG